MSLLPSSYFGGPSLEKGTWRDPHEGCTRLLQVPSAERIGSQGLQFTFATGHWTLNAAMEKLCTILHKSIIGLLIAEKRSNCFCLWLFPQKLLLLLSYTIRNCAVTQVFYIFCSSIISELVIYLLQCQTSDPIPERVRPLQWPSTLDLHC